jgi:endonuclease-3
METLMATTINKQRLLDRLFTTLKKAYDPGDPADRPVLEQFVFALCREGTTHDQAEQAFRNLCERFFDWNEVRVSSLRELEECLADLPEPDLRAQRIIGFLQEVFETTFSFDLEPLQKKGLKQAAKQLARFQAANDYAVSWVVQRTLGGHSIPLDTPTTRALRRLTLIDGEDGNTEALQASLEHLIPKSRGPLFSDLISALADKVCWEDSPNCAGCPLVSDCPTGQENRRELAGSRAGRVKPR